MQNIKPCSYCNTEPEIQSDELGIMYRLVCIKCNKYTQDLISPNSTLENPKCDNETFDRLVEEWNSKN